MKFPRFAGNSAGNDRLIGGLAFLADRRHCVVLTMDIW